MSQKNMHARTIYQRNILYNNPGFVSSFWGSDDQSEYKPHKIHVSKMAKEAKKDPQELTVEQKLKELHGLRIR